MAGQTEHIGAQAHASLRTFGYAVLRNVFTREQTAALKALSDRMSADAAAILAAAAQSGGTVADHARESRDALIVVPEASDPTQVCRYEYMIGSTPDFRAFVRDVLEPIVETALGEPVVPFKDKTNEKASGGGAFGAHQDYAAYQFFPPRFHVTALVSIDPATRANGCVQFARNYQEIAEAYPGDVVLREDRHALFRYHDGGPQNGDIVESIAGRFTWDAVELAPADLVVFDSFVPHFSEPNASPAPRRGMFLTFNRAAEGDCYAQYYDEKRKNYHDPKFHVSTPTWRGEHRSARSPAAVPGRRPG